jgi:hypothetical protein
MYQQYLAIKSYIKGNDKKIGLWGEGFGNIVNARQPMKIENRIVIMTYFSGICSMA